MRPSLQLSFGLMCVLFTAHAVCGQQIAVQQPVIQNFSVGTTVSVPDRGSAHLGSVGSAFSGRTTTGPFRSGSSYGLERQSSSASVQVSIHDFEAMDAELLAAPTNAATTRIDPRISRRLQPNRRSEGTVSPSSSRTVADAERLAEQAEARGRFVVAKLHWQRAARHGSTRAAQRLAVASVQR